MTQALTLAKIQPPKVEPATDEAIANYLRYTCKIAEVAALVEQDAVIAKAAEELGIVVTDAELQAAGDEFRLKNQLLGASETLAWLARQGISAEDWTQGIRLKLLTQKLKEHLFLDAIDSHYLSYREEYRRAAFSQILVSELPEALQIVQTLRSGNTSFAAMAIEHSKAQPSAQHGGFVGIRFLSNLMPEIKAAIANVPEGEIINPIKTHLGYHILRVEKWFPPQLNESVRSEIMELLWQNWLKN
ncbi:peptidylprolyl isomerase [Merismopedia glauca]|uniref:peptidylprolyl isomerase n=1 Tax=Merismopedia glauca CCAP 1448/3 TaxID=1296344 RepID=A0A2T1C228_9CYAN|nr:peptidylprolyl isomerase [Merismopedia glauca]PSB02207.1 peptidylprolyl isomerase [Merismopedia glauca CCAP 1448/3]